MSSKGERNDSCLDKPAVDECSRSKDIAGLLALPIELLSSIFTYLSYTDFANARLWNRHSHGLLSSGEIPRRCYNLHVPAPQLAITPPPSPVTFAYILEQRRRAAAVRACVWEIMMYLDREIIPHTPSLWVLGDRRNWSSQCSALNLGAGLTISLSVLSDYWARCLSQLRRPSTEQAKEKNISFAEFKTIYPRAYYRVAKAALPFLSWLVQQLLHRPSYAGFLERTLRGWHSDALDPAGFEWYLLLTNVRALTQILPAKTYKERRKVVERGLRCLDPERSVKWRECWRHVLPGAGAERELGRSEAQELVALPSTPGEVTGFAVPLGEGAPFGGYGTPEQAMNFVREAGLQDHRDSYLGL